METLNEHKTQISQDKHHQNTWGFTAKSDQESIEETSTISNESLSISSSSSLHTADDASSTLSSLSSSLNSNGPSALDLSDLMSHLPIKRGLSKFYHGKSESFTSLARVMSIEDLPKRSKNPYSKMRKMKSNSKSYGGGGLDSFKTHTLPKPIISKKFSSFLKQRITRSTLILGQQDN